MTSFDESFKDPLNIEDYDSDASTRTCTISYVFTPGRPIITNDAIEKSAAISLVNRNGSDASSEDSLDNLISGLKSPARYIDQSLDYSRTEDLNNEISLSMNERSTNPKELAIKSAVKAAMPPLFSYPNSPTESPEISEVLDKFDRLLSRVDKLEKEIESLRTENTLMVAENERLQKHIDSMLEIVPSDPVFVEKEDTRGEYVLKWTNKLRAQLNVDMYNIGLEDKMFRIKAPNQRAVLSQPFDNQIIKIQPIQLESSTGKPQTSKITKFVFKASQSEKENCSD
ncbi:hypothetical protein M3Y94_00574600 [Aphelenchoides besseyi]|nr:hypothetical protein M3Y94_00574600 [Aphelenchoides besseyi]KAI6218061.1 hypothetical protein M3Y95_01180200 [Aphelenchoides besseyi]